MNTIELRINGIAQYTQSLVGSLGEGKVPVQSDNGQPGGEIHISRGGLLVPHQTYDEYYEAKRRDFVYKGSKGPFKDGDPVYPGAMIPEEAFFDPTVIHVAYTTGGKLNGQRPDRSADFLLHQEQLTATWLAYLLNKSGVLPNPYIHVDTYFLGDAIPIETEENVMVLEGLLTVFDSGVRARQTHALELANAPILQS